MFKTKREYQYNQILKWVKEGKRTSKSKLARKMGISRVTLNKLLATYDSVGFLRFNRSYSNNRTPDKIRKNLFEDTIKLLEAVNVHREDTTFLPTFATIKPFIDHKNLVSL